MTAVAPQLCAHHADVASRRAECQRPDLVAPYHPRSRRHGGQEFRLPHPRVGCGELARMNATPSVAETAWERGRFDAGRGPSKVLFGRMYEDASIECGAFRAGGRVFCIASAGCTAMQLAPRHEVVAVDINPAQLAYAERRFAGQQGMRGTAERIMAFGRALAPAAGWRASTLQRIPRPRRSRRAEHVLAPPPRHLAIPRRGRWTPFARVAAHRLCVALSRLPSAALRRGDARAHGPLLLRGIPTDRIPTRVRCSPANCPTKRRPTRRSRFASFTPTRRRTSIASLKGASTGLRCRIFSTGPARTTSDG